MTARFEVAFLGTGSPLPSPDRCGAGQVVVAGGTHVLVDCGWGAARRLQPAGVQPAAIDTAIFTHMHSDHITDFPDFLFLRWTGGATRPLRIFGPEGTREMAEGFLLALRRDIGFRLAHHSEKLHPDGIAIEVVEVPASATPSAFLELDGLEVEAFEVDHFPVTPAFGHRFRYDGRAVVLSGDTALCPSLLAAAENADLLVCEALNLPMVEQRIAALRSMGMEGVAGLLSDVPSYHITTDQVAALARDAGVRELALSHLVPPISNDPGQVEAFTAGMSAIYPGPIRVPRDTERIAVPKRGMMSG